MPPALLGTADLHLHTRASDGLMSAAALLAHVEAHTQLDVVAITDHDHVSAGLWARDEAARQGLRVQVISGVEVSTRQGHLIGLWIEERPPAFRGYEETAEWIVARGGLCLAPHPFARITPSVDRATLERCVQQGLIAGVEVWNPSPAGRASHAGALAFAAQHTADSPYPVAEIGSSDAHWKRIVGMASTRFPGRSLADLRAALQAGTTLAEGRFARPLELAVEALPQTVWATAILPARRARSYARDLLAARRTLGATPATSAA